MPRIVTRNSKYLLLFFFVIFFIGGKPAEFGQEGAFFHGFLIHKPIIRIALGVNLEDIRIRASSGMKIYEVGGDYKLLASDAAEVRVKGRKEALSEKFVVQVAQARKKEDAEKIAETLKAKLGRRVYVAQDPQSSLGGIYHVRVGDFFTRGTALEFIKGLAPQGIKDAWIVREEVTVPVSKPQWVLVNDKLLALNEQTSLYFVPSSLESYLSHEGKNYRGILVLRGSPKGIVLINILNIEDYLRGVVPQELSPVNFGELEAQKAQAVAARTYALKNIGQFEDLGFDVFATPVSQVYDGMSAEHVISDRAVEQTRGEVAVYGGKLINALYTSTCGGATEDCENIFESLPEPYLKGTECIMEQEEEWHIQSAAALPAVFLSGVNVCRALALLAALDILPRDLPAGFFKENARLDETVEWIRNACVRLGKRNDKFAPEDRRLDFAGLARLLIEGFEWQERAENLVGRSEGDLATKNFSNVRPEEKSALAYFVVSGIFPDSREPGDAERVLTKAETAYYLSRAMALNRDFYHLGYLKSVDKNKLDVFEGDERKVLDLAPDAMLFRSLENAVSLVPALDLSGGDILKWVESRGRVTLLEAVATPLTNILDRPSQYHRWEIRISREDLESRINQYYPVGKLVDLVPQKRGVSKRVIALSIIGREGQANATGLNIRQVLNLRDSLFVIDREKDEQGNVTHFIFSGKGWGHGVGLCQVGAYRMAQKGAAYDDILKKYYRGIKLDKIY